LEYGKSFSIGSNGIIEEVGLDVEPNEEIVDEAVETPENGSGGGGKTFLEEGRRFHDNEKYGEDVRKTRRR
jgi:hypothetical protein